MSGQGDVLDTNSQDSVGDDIVPSAGTSSAQNGSGLAADVVGPVDPLQSPATGGEEQQVQPNGTSANSNVEGAQTNGIVKKTSTSARRPRKSVQLRTLETIQRWTEEAANRSNPPTPSTGSTIPPYKPGSAEEQLAKALHAACQPGPATTEPTPAQSKEKYRIPLNARPRSSIPSNLSTSVYAQQCVAAAEVSRLNPYALHQGENSLLENDLDHGHVTTYLHIRNGILRLWTRNPMVSVTEEEALGCAKDVRYMGLASVAYYWLIRNGYINFGCVEVPKPLPPTKRGRRKANGPTIVIIGAGMAGLGCARQLEGLFSQYACSVGNARVILLEGRSRIGGRIYSHPLQSLESNTLPPGLRSTAEMGAQIIMGFDHGNPLDAIIRGQLALRYHLMRDNLLLYDVDGSQVDEIHDAMAEKLYIDVLDRLEKYRHQTIAPRTAQGDRELINSGRESHIEDGVTIRKYLDAAASGTIELILPAKRGRRGIKHKTADLEPAVGSVLPDLTQTKQHSAALASQAMGWKWREGISSEDTLLLDDLANASTTQSLGLLMDEAVRQYVKMLPLTPEDMRLLNWHYANLEYSNASLSGNLSLTGWDQDSGNEFEGAHAHVIGGYQQLPRGLYMLPTKLDVRTNKAVSKVVYDPRDSPKKKAQVYCEDGEVIQADKVVFTASLGVLKKQAIQFEPELPEWKSGAIDRIGFGVMNKVILVFEKPFWDVEKDMFGLLRESKTANSLSQADYAPGRGKCYMFWNCMPTTGLPVLIGIMAGEAALEVGKLSDTAILTDIISQLRNVFKSTAVPDPVETIITRWGQDKFCYGSYSSVAPEAMPADYDLMAKSIGNLYFAGEATSRNHPATVHGAYLSGLRVASEVLESVIGPIQIPKPLVPPKAKATNGTPQSGNGSVAGQKRKSPDA